MLFQKLFQSLFILVLEKKNYLITVFSICFVPLLQLSFRDSFYLCVDSFSPINNIFYFLS